MKDEQDQLLKRLKAPMAFLGEERSKYVIIDDQKVLLSSFLKDVTMSKQKKISLLKVRYEYIEERLKEIVVSTGEQMDLFTEGIAIKRAIHLVLKKDISSDLEDIERWLSFGRKVS